MTSLAPAQMHMYRRKSGRMQTKPLTEAGVGVGVRGGAVQMNTQLVFNKSICV